jgi:hypothetical protein
VELGATMPYDPINDIKLRLIQSDVRRLTRELRLHYNEKKQIELFYIMKLIREHVAKQIAKHGVPPGWESN